MKRSVYILLLIAIISPVHSFSQYFDIDTIKGQSPYIKAISYIFPHLTSRTNQAAADRINEDLVEDMLQIDSGEYYKSIFEKVWGDTDRIMPTLNDISYQVINNDTDFFCISISAEGCGAYCETFTRYYAFESRSGNYIILDTLFTKDGLRALMDSVHAEKNMRVKQQITDIEETYKKSISEVKDNPEIYPMAIIVYTECIDSLHNSYVESDYSLDKKNLSIYSSNCLPHMLRALDEVDYTFTFELKGIKKYLSAYGKSLLKL